MITDVPYFIGSCISHTFFSLLLSVTHHHDGTLQASGRVLLELYLKLLHYLSLVVQLKLLLVISSVVAVCDVER